MTLFTQNTFAQRSKTGLPHRACRPERKNPFTFDSYAEFRNWFRALAYCDDIHAVVILPNGGNFSSGGCS